MLRCLPSLAKQPVIVSREQCAVVSPHVSLGKYDSGVVAVECRCLRSGDTDAQMFIPHYDCHINPCIRWNADSVEVDLRVAAGFVWCAERCDVLVCISGSARRESKHQTLFRRTVVSDAQEALCKFSSIFVKPQPAYHGIFIGDVVVCENAIWLYILRPVIVFPGMRYRVVGQM